MREKCVFVPNSFSGFPRADHFTANLQIETFLIPNWRAPARLFVAIFSIRAYPCPSVVKMQGNSTKGYGVTSGGILIFSGSTNSAIRLKINPMRRIYCLVALLLLSGPTSRAETVALWLFDEQEGLYPSCPLSDATPNGLHLILGRGGSIVPGKFGGALGAVEPEDWEPVYEPSSEETYIRFGLKAPEREPGRTVEPLTWFNNRFAALFTNGNGHLRRLEFANATRTALNLGSDDWTVEFWLKLDERAEGEGVVFEIGSGPRGENDRVDPAFRSFRRRICSVCTIRPVVEWPNFAPRELFEKVGITMPSPMKKAG